MKRRLRYLLFARSVPMRHPKTRVGKNHIFHWHWSMLWRFLLKTWNINVSYKEACTHTILERSSQMPEPTLLQQLSINDAISAVNEYDDIHYTTFRDFLFNELLAPVRSIPNESIIANHLQDIQCVYKTAMAHSLMWLYCADRCLIRSTNIYSFRFSNPCHPDLYKELEVRGYHLFKPVKKPRHRYDVWYEYVGEETTNELGKYVNIQRVVDGRIPCRTKIFIHQEQERLNIQFRFPSIDEHIAICFEPGYPATEK